jgi:hypothetical protein
MIGAITLFTLFIYGLLCLSQWITFGTKPWYIRYKEIVTISTVTFIIVLIESFK